MKRRRFVILRCPCGRELDRVDLRIGGPILLGPDVQAPGSPAGRAAIVETITARGVTYRCPKCGTPHEVAIDKVTRLAARARELGVDLVAGRPNYGVIM